MNVLVLGVLYAALASPAPVRLLVVTGGHDYPTSFYTVFEQDGLTWDHAVSNEEAFRKDLRGRYDALVLYDGSEKISSRPVVPGAREKLGALGVETAGVEGSVGP